MEKICIIQTGRLGDTLISLPIARYYQKKGYLIDWAIHESIKGVFDYIEYVDNLIIIPNEVDIMYSIPFAYNMIESDKYSKIIDLSIGFPGSSVYKYTDENFLQSFVHVKYYLAGVDIKEKWNLEFTRNIKKEDELYSIIICDSEEYVLIHNEDSLGRKHEMDISNDKKKIYVRKIDGYEIFDWYKIIKNADEIYCIDSSFCNFIDATSDFKDIKKNISRARGSSQWLTPPLKNWKII
jgi:hypothetical protein